MIAASRRTVEQLVEDATEARKLLKRDAESAMDRGLLPRAPVETITGRVGNELVAFELLGLVQIFRQHWAKMEGRTPITLEELEDAALLGEQLMDELCARKEQPESVKLAAADRAGAFTLFARAHRFARDEQGDAEEILPSDEDLPNSPVDEE